MAEPRRSILLVVMGVPGAGKTSLSRDLQRLAGEVSVGRQSIKFHGSSSRWMVGNEYSNVAHIFVQQARSTKSVALSGYEARLMHRFL